MTAQRCRKSDRSSSTRPDKIGGRVFTALLAAAFIMVSAEARAACSNPAGAAGDLIFNDQQNVMQYCNDTQWVGISLVSGSVPGGCTTIGQECDDGSVYAGISPDGSGRMFTTHCDTGMTWNGTTCTGSRTFYAYNNANASGDTNAGTDSAFDGDGNTALLLTTDADSVTGGTQPHQAATVCGDLAVHGYSDWYLPSIDELDVLRANRVAIGGFNTSTSPDQRLWSSTQNGQFTAWRQNFGTGVQGDPVKDELNTVRCVRKIPSVSGVAPIPTVIHTVTADYPYHLVKESSYIYVADNWNSASEGGMNIFSASDPAAMSLVGSVSHANMQGAWGIDVAGSYAFVAAEQDDGVASVNITTPSSPTYSHFVTHANLGGARGLKIAGNHAFVAAYDVDRLTSVNISNPASMSYAGSVTHTSMDGASDVDIQGLYAYVASSIADSLTVVSIYDPAAPTRTGSVNGMDGANSVAVSGNYAYVTASNADALYVVDISNPAAPTIAGSVTDAVLDGAKGVALKGSFAIVSAAGTSDRLVVVDVSNPAAPSIFGSSVSDSSALAGGDIVVDGNYAYVIGDFKLSSVNMAPPCANPAGIKGDIIYNTDDSVMQYCDGGGSWRAMGPIGGVNSCTASATTYTTAGTDTYIMPAGCSQVTVEAWGAGGAGSLDSLGQRGAGGGGGASAVVKNTGSVLLVVGGGGGGGGGIDDNPETVSRGGGGGYASATEAVAAGEQLNVFIGGGGSPASLDTGGSGGVSGTYAGGKGGNRRQNGTGATYGGAGAGGNENNGGNSTYGGAGGAGGEGGSCGTSTNGGACSTTYGGGGGGYSISGGTVTLGSNGTTGTAANGGPGNGVNGNNTGGPGKVVITPSGGGGSTCSGPAGTSGDMIYNEDHDSMQYCANGGWVRITK